MNYIKLFENFEDHIFGQESKNLTKKLLPYNLKDMHNKISLYKLADKIYSVVIEDSHLRAMIFLRFQEYYESSSNEFRGKKFKWDRYIQWYKGPDSPNGERECFTYGDDWSGFNIPSESIENCLNDIDDKNHYDDVMISIINKIREEENGNFYLIGIDELNIDGWLLDHEMAHGFYYTDITYRNNVNSLIKLLPIDEKESISNVIMELGYSESVLNDEIQAYMSTGLYSKMDESLKRYTSDFEENFKEYKKRHHASPIKLEINYDIKLFEYFADFTKRMKNGYTEFDSTFNDGNIFNSWGHFRDARKNSITPERKYLDEVINLIKKILSNSIFSIEWKENFRQIYCYMWSGKTHMNYMDHIKSNKKLLIVDFYEDDWIFCCIVDENVIRSEKHYVCDSIYGLENFLNDKKEYIITKVKI